MGDGAINKMEKLTDDNWSYWRKVIYAILKKEKVWDIVIGNKIAPTGADASDSATEEFVDEAVVDETEENLPDKTYNSATNSEASDASGAEDTEGDAVALRRTTRANAGVPPVRYSDAGLLAQALEADVQVQEPSSWKEAMKSQQAE